MSAIHGDGYGSAHSWVHDITDIFGREKGSRYICEGCGQVFVHLYDVNPDIFSAMGNYGVPESCSAVSAETTDVLGAAIQAAQEIRDSSSRSQFEAGELHGVLLLASWVDGFTRDYSKPEDAAVRAIVARGLTVVVESGR